MKTRIIREACVETRAEIDAAIRGGADRIELCSRLDVGGFTPEVGLLAYAVERGMAVAAMVRRAAGFSADDEDLSVLQADIRAMIAGGAQALVFGYIRGNPSRLDMPVLEALAAGLAKANPVPEPVFHMAFDALPPDAHFAAIDTLAGMGFTRILTKGGEGKAEENLVHLKALNDYARGKITLLCGGSVTDANYLDIAEFTGISEFHGRKLASG
jgi:copper homeostasis protein